MVNFVIVDDNIQILKMVESIIHKTMINNPLEYKINKFGNYDSKFNKIMRSNIPNKVYILDIETTTVSGIDIARKIRKDDIDSVIIFITSHEELGSIIIKDSLMVLTFICKFDDFENKLKSAVIKSLEVIGSKKLIRFTDNNSLYTIPLKSILYITKDSIERKSVIKTDYGEYKVSKTLIELKELSCGNLIQTHKSCLVNEERILTVDKTNKLITFDNGETIDLLTDFYKKELV